MSQSLIVDGLPVTTTNYNSRTKICCTQWCKENFSEWTMESTFVWLFVKFILILIVVAIYTAISGMEVNGELFELTFMDPHKIVIVIISFICNGFLIVIYTRWQHQIAPWWFKMLSTVLWFGTAIFFYCKRSIPDDQPIETNKVAFDLWTIVHTLTGVLLGWMVPFMWMIISVVIWEVIELFVYDVGDGVSMNAIADVVVAIIGWWVAILMFSRRCIPWISSRKVIEFSTSCTTTGYEQKYDDTARWYDFIDYMWEKNVYSTLRPVMIGDLSGRIIEAGVGTGNNLAYYNEENISELVAFDISSEMLSIAQKKQKKYKLLQNKVRFLHRNVTQLIGVNSNYFDVYVTSFLFCVLPNEQQPAALDEMRRVLKIGGKFRIVELVYSQNRWQWIKQKLFQPWINYWFGASFDRKTLEFIENNEDLKITKQEFIKSDILLMIEGMRIR